jgi:pyruvate formate-lyase/glycerol dehydratase family glycyl radical enzyme
MYTLSPITPRVRKMRERYRDSLPTGDCERTKIVTEYYKTSLHEVPIIRRAKALHEILSKMTVRIEDDELIAGNSGKYYRGAVLAVEYNGIGWLPEELKNGSFDNRTFAEGKFSIPQEDRDYLLSVADFWTDKNHSAFLQFTMPEELASLATANVIPYDPLKFAAHHGHFNANYEKLLKKGLGAVKKEAQQALEALRANIRGNDAEKFYFYKAVEICCDAAIIFSKRLGAEALRQADALPDGSRRRELMAMADTLNWIMENPVRSFRDAVQAVFLYHLILCLEGTFGGQTIGRLDQHVGGYLESELSSGTITKEEAQELIDCFCLKVAEVMSGMPGSAAVIAGAYTGNMRLTLAGRKKDGSDATNEATYMTLQAIARLILHDPTLSLCLHKDSPKALWEAGIETSRLVGGNPTLDNADMVISMLHNKGLTLEDARNFCVIGCVELSGSGCEFANVSGPFSKSFFNSANLVLQAINDGKNITTGQQGGLHTGFLYDMTSFEDVKAAFSKQLNYFMDWFLTFNNLTEYVGNPQVPLPMASATMDGCMENSRDMLTGGAKYNSTGNVIVALGTCVDSLAAIKYLVFDKKLCTGRELLDALKANWEGCEALRQRAVNEVPHFGNGDPYADELASFVSDLYTAKVDTFAGPRGSYRAGSYTAGFHVLFGLATGATPNGRKAGEPTSDGASPSQACDKNGPTGVAKSIAALHPRNYANGMQFTMKFHPSCVQGADGAEKLRSFVEAFFEMDGMQVQFNVVSSDILRDAQTKPGDYKDLVVRVAGFSAYFVELGRTLQDDLINRTDIQI